jgi:hypothetical protein
MACPLRGLAVTVDQLLRPQIRMVHPAVADDVCVLAPFCPSSTHDAPCHLAATER